MQQQKKKTQGWTRDLLRDVQAVRLRIANRANVNERLTGGMTPLHRAVAYDAPEEVIDLLLRAGADPLLRDDLGWTPLMLAASTNAVGPALPLVRRRPPPPPNGELYETLYHSVLNGSNDVLLLLLNHGASVNHRSDFFQMTPLHWSLIPNPPRLDTFRILLDRGADIGIRDRNHRTAIHLAAELDNTTFLLELLDRGADIGARNINGDTALHVAAGYDRTENIRLLLKRGADPNIQNRLGQTALHLTVENHLERDVVDLLFSYGADPYLRDSFRRTVFSAAHGNNDIQRALLEHGYIPLPDEVQYDCPEEIATLARARMDEIRQAQQRFRLVNEQEQQKTVRQAQQRFRLVNEQEQQKTVRQAQQRFRLVNEQEQQKTVRQPLSQGSESARRAVQLAKQMPHELFHQLVRYGAPSVPRDKEQKNRFEEWCRGRGRKVEQTDLLTRARWLEQMRYQQKRSARKR